MFIKTYEDWLYLAVMLDLQSRKVIGWSMSNRNDIKLVSDTLTMAINARNPKKGVIHHTDRGTPHQSHSYKALQVKHGMISSMSHKGDCYDNAVAEGFFHSRTNLLITKFTKLGRRQEQTYLNTLKYFTIVNAFTNALGYKPPL